jgi:hypothetical protein
MEKAVLVEGCWVSSARVHGRWCLLRGAVSALLSVADPTPKVPHHHPSNISTSARKKGPFASVVLSVDRCVL